MRNQHTTRAQSYQQNIYILKNFCESLNTHLYHKQKLFCRYLAWLTNYITENILLQNCSVWPHFQKSVSIFRNFLSCTDNREHLNTGLVRYSYGLFQMVPFKNQTYLSVFTLSISLDLWYIKKVIKYVSFGYPGLPYQTFWKLVRFWNGSTSLDYFMYKKNVIAYVKRSWLANHLKTRPEMDGNRQLKKSDTNCVHKLTIWIPGCLVFGRSLYR
jgi:hypothetical protein